MPRGYDSLIPGIEHREAAWLHLQERLARVEKPKCRPTITLSREFGCEGYPMAEGLKLAMEEKTGEPWVIYDKALLEKVATDENLSMHLLSHLGECNRAADILKNQFGYLTQDKVYSQIVKHLIQIATLGNAIIVGRGGAVVCHEMKNCFHFRLEGSLEFRVKTLARRMELPLEEAEAFVRKQSELREKFISECLQTDITSSRWYDAVFNNEKNSVDAMAGSALILITARY